MRRWNVILAIVGVIRNVIYRTDGNRKIRFQQEKGFF